MAKDSYFSFEQEEFGGISCHSTLAFDLLRLQMLGHSLQSFQVAVLSVSSLAKEGQRTLELASSCFLLTHLKLHGLSTARLKINK